MRQHFSLTSKVTLTFVFFAVVLLIIIGFLAYSNGRDALESATFSDLLSAAIEKEASLEVWIGGAQRQIKNITESPFIEQQITILQSDLDADDIELAHNRLVDELQPLVGDGHIFVDLMVLNAETGQVIASTNISEEGKFKEDRLYFINGKSSLYFQNVYFSLSCECPSMAASAPIQSRDGELLAVIVGRLNLIEMAGIINRQTGLRETSDAYLVNTANLLITQPRLITDPVILRRGIRTEITQQCLSGQSGSTQSVDYRGEPVIATYRWLPDREMCLTVKVDLSEALAPVYVFGQVLLLLSLATLIIASIMAVALARTITRPILALQESVTSFGKGNINSRFIYSSNDEIGALGHEFNTMADSIVEKETLLQNYAQTLEQKVAERTTQLTFLAHVSRTLAESFDYEESLRRLAELVVPDIADWCSIDILDDDHKLQRIAVVHQDPEKVALAYELEKRYPADPSGSRGSYQVLQTGKPDFFPEITDDMLNAMIEDPELLDLVRRLGLKSSITVPLMSNRQTLGVMTFVMAESGRHFDESDLNFTDELARRAGLLIDNAKLYNETKELNEDLEQRVIERTAHLTAVNRELEAFSYSVSHDLRAPLRAIDGFSMALLEDYEDSLDEMGRDFLNRIRVESQRMGQLIDDLISLSRFTRTDMSLTYVSLSDIANEIVKELRQQEPERNVAVTIQEDVIVCADRRLIRVALQNLLQNAWKFTTKQTDAHIEFGCNQNDGLIEYYVRDNGAGFDMAYVHKLFGAFQRLHAMTEFEGTGIGLAIVNRVIQRHGGTIRATAAIGKGATFIFTLQGNCDD